MVTEMTPLYEKYDVLITAGEGPAPRLDAHRSIGVSDKWRKPNITTPFNVTGGPALSQCIGFSKSGLPLSMQVVGKPFDDEAVFKVGHAYEQATTWRAQRPVLNETMAATPFTHKAIPPSETEIDGATRDLVKKLAQRAGLKLSDQLFEQLCEVAPYALAMAQRIRRDHPWEDEIANVFRFPNLS